jgi:hypothetical protein
MAFAMIPMPTEVVGAHGMVRMCCFFTGPIPERMIVADQHPLCNRRLAVDAITNPPAVWSEPRM